MSRLLTRNWTRRGASGLIVPGAEPDFTNAPGETSILDTDLTEPQYADAVTAGKAPYADGDFVGPRRFVPFNSPAVGGLPVDTNKEEIVTINGARWLRNKYSGVAGDSVNWIFYPSLDATERCIYGWKCSQIWTLTTGEPQNKNIMAFGQTINPQDNGRIEVCTAPYDPGGVHEVLSVYDQGYADPVTDMNSPFNTGIPQFGDGLEHTVTMYWQWHKRSTGTVDRLVYQLNPDPNAHPTFNVSQASSGIHENCRIRLKNSTGTAYASAAEFIVTNYNGGQLATLTRANDITGDVVDYSGGIFFLADVVYKGLFSVSQAGHLSNGDHLAINAVAQSSTSCIVQSFDGTTGCLLPQYNRPSANVAIQDQGQLWFSRPSDQDGFLEYWLDGRKVIHVSPETQDIVPEGGSRPWCTQHTRALFGVGASLVTIQLGNGQANPSGPWTLDNGRRLKLWKKAIA